MPLNSIPSTVSVAALEAKRAAARGRCHVDVAFWGGVVPGNAGELRALRDAGVAGFKCFLVPSGVEEFAPVDVDDLRRALPILAGLGAPLLVHAELPGPIAAATPSPRRDPRRYDTYLASRPPSAEAQAVALLIGLCRQTGARIHIVHVSAAETIPLLRAARAEGLPLTAETCPHYLHFAAEDVPDGATELKCAPPIRGRANREALWAALAEGVLDMVVSDHSPCSEDLKLRDTGDFMNAWGGIASLQLSLSVVWAGARTRGHGIPDVVRWMAQAPARLAGLDARKGAIAEGRDADLVAWRPDAEWRVEPARLHHRTTLTPYAGLMLPGVVTTTWLRGEEVHRDGRAVGPRRGRRLAQHEAAWTSPS
jgi:allantoinase